MYSSGSSPARDVTDVTGEPWLQPWSTFAAHIYIYIYGLAGSWHMASIWLSRFVSRDFGAQDRQPFKEDEE